jgi:ATP-binding cassette subfamily C exporter for protease/lipase
MPRDPFRNLRHAQGELTRGLFAFRSAFLSVWGFSLAINVLLLMPSIYMLQVYDRVLSSRNEVTLLMLTLIMAGLYGLEAALEFVRGRVLVRTTAAIDVAVSPRVFDAAFERGLRSGPGHAGRALSDLSCIRYFLTGQGLFAFFDTPWTPLYLLVIFLLSPWLGLFAVVAAVALLGLAWLNERLTGPALAEAARLQQHALAYAGANLRNAEVIEAMGMLAALRRRWIAKQMCYLPMRSSVTDRSVALAAVTRFVRLFSQSAVLGLGALLVIENKLTPGGMIAASILLGRALAPVELAIATWRQFVAARSAHERLNELLSEHPPRGERLSLPRPLGIVTAENIVVAPPGGGAPILKGLTFRVKPGLTIAVVGPSASGKSTLARALVGVWSPLAGAFRLDGADIHTWAREEVGPWIGYLPQDVELFEGSIAENIARFGVAAAEDVVDAARKAGVHELSLRFPHGYDTVLGEGGFTLSAGQRQRIALARALYGDPALIVLDEPNANLDEAGDLALIAALGIARAESRTVFVVTHRANVLAAVDAVMVIAEGTIQAFGPRDAVMKAYAARTTLPDGSAGETVIRQDAA